jgi:predicted transcriptional regulator
MSKRVEVNVGNSEREGSAFRERIAQARAQRESTRKTSDLSESGGNVERAFSLKRLKLLRAVHANPAPSIKGLAERLSRDHKRVHEDVETASGVLRRENGSDSAPDDAITAEMRL